MRHLYADFIDRVMLGNTDTARSLMRLLNTPSGSVAGAAAAELSGSV